MMKYQYGFFVGTGFLNHKDWSLHFHDVFHGINHRMVTWSHQVRGQSRGVSIEKKDGYQAPKVQ